MGKPCMELHFTVLAILLLTLLACCGIRRAEDKIIERHRLDQRARNVPLPAAIDGEVRGGTKAQA